MSKVKNKMKIGDIEIPDKNIKCFSVTIDNNLDILYLEDKAHFVSPYKDITYDITTYDNRHHFYRIREYNNSNKIQNAPTKKQ